MVVSYYVNDIKATLETEGVASGALVVENTMYNLSYEGSSINQKRKGLGKRII